MTKLCSNKYIVGYFFLGIIPLSFMGLAKQQMPITFFRLMIHEIFLFFLILITFFGLRKNQIKIRINLLDLFTIMFVFFGLISVLFSFDNLYVAARDYRHNYFVPLLIFIFFQTFFDTPKQLLNSIFSIVPILFISQILVLPNAILAGNRMEGTFLSGITLGFLSIWVVVSLFISKKIFKSLISKFLLIFLIVFFFFIIFYQASRGVIVGFFFGIAMNKFFSKSKLRQLFFIFSVIAIAISFYFFIFTIANTFEKEIFHRSSEYRQIETSFSRLFSIEHYKQDLLGRLEFWAKAFRLGLESPFFGIGLHSIRTSATIDGISTPHNIFISVFTSSGIFGVSLFISLIVLFFSIVFSLPETKNYYELKTFLMIIFIVLLFVGATNDFTGGRFLYFFVLLSIASKSEKLVEIDRIKETKINKKQSGLSVVFNR